LAGGALGSDLILLGIGSQCKAPADLDLAAVHVEVSVRL
jgi:hypothetical protein